MLNPMTLLPYGVERPRTARQFILDKMIKGGLEALSEAEFNYGKHIGLVQTVFPWRFFSHNGEAHS